MLIERVFARKILDSRKKPTIELELDGCKASSPSGKSTGESETPMYHISLDWCINFLNKTKFNLEIDSFEDIEKLEKFLKNNLSFRDVKKFGANSLFALESIFLKVLAKRKKIPLWKLINPKARKMPVPLGNSVGGGLHSEDFDGHPTFQEFLIIPLGKTFSQRLGNMNKVYNSLSSLLKSSEKNDEGAWQTKFSNEDVLGILSRFKDFSGVGLDIASTSFYDKKQKLYLYGNISLNKTAQIHYINELIKRYNILYVEDPLEEKDFDGFSKIIKKNMVCGDDLTATHLTLLKKALKKNSINSMIIKPNQNGSLLELSRIIRYCKDNKIKTIFSHRSGETLDDSIADYAFGFQTDFVKFGVSTPWRENKLKRLCEIESSL